MVEEAQRNGDEHSLHSLDNDLQIAKHCTGQTARLGRVGPFKVEDVLEPEDGHENQRRLDALLHVRRGAVLPSEEQLHDDHADQIGKEKEVDLQNGYMRACNDVQ